METPTSVDWANERTVNGLNGVTRADWLFGI